MFIPLIAVLMKKIYPLIFIVFLSVLISPLAKSTAGKNNFLLNPNTIYNSIYASGAYLDGYSKSIEISPNPVVQDLHICNRSDDTIQKITLHNISGEQLKCFKPSDTKIHLADIPTGMYYIKIATDNGTNTRKFIKSES